MKATNFIRKDHENLKSLFGKYRQVNAHGQNGKKALSDAIRREFSIHADLETSLFYPELLNTSSARATDLVHRALEAHAAIDRKLDEIRAANGNEKESESLLLKLIDQMETHFESEEDGVLDEARQFLSEPRLEELGLEMEQRRRLLTQAAA